MSKKNKPVGIEDVAKAAGVSITTVSRVINKFPSVRESNRIRVEEAIKRLRFKPNVAAQRLASGSNNTIGLEIPRYEGIFYSFYAMEIFRSVGIACDELKVDLLMHLTDGRTAINSAAVGGVVFADIIRNEEHLREILDYGVPVVVMNYHLEKQKITTVAVDNVKGARAAVDYLISLKHRRIAFITGDLATQAASERLEGYKASLAGAGVPFDDAYLLRGDYSRKSARTAAENILRMVQKPTAVFVSSDDMAVEVISVFLAAGLRVPDDISVIGFDDDPVCLYGPVSLTTIRQPLREMAQTAVKELYLKMQDPNREIRHVILPTELVIRDSVSAAKV